MAQQLQQKEDALLEAMVHDALQRSERWHRPCFVGFLDEREQMVVRNLMDKAGDENYMFWGGHDGAERVVFGAFSASVMETAKFPLIPVTATFRKQDTLSHRDFLGALMSLGIERSTVGDILVEEGRCVLFLREEILPYVLAQVRKIGSVGVQLKAGADQPYPDGRRFRLFSTVVSSLRADCIVAACAGWSREKTKTAITAGLVTVNHAVCPSLSAVLAQGDTIAIRGKGKFCLETVGHLTKKGRVGIEIKKYI